MKIKIFILVIFFLLFDIVYAKSSTIVMDIDSKRILYEDNIYDKKLIASTTKIMTGLITLENYDLDKVITVGDEVLSAYGSNSYIEKDEELKVIDLLYGLFLRSGNDSALVLSNNILGGSKEFINLMNKKALEIGMKDTTFSNPTGLDDVDYNYSTCYDMALLSSYAYNNKLYRLITTTSKYKLQTNKKSYIWFNRNKMVNDYKYLTSGKTGYTPKAGKTLVTTASNNNLNLTIVSLNDPNHYQNQIDLYEKMFKKYKKYLILDHNKFKIDNNFYKKKVYIKKSFSYPLTDIEKDNIKVIVKLLKKDKVKDNDLVGYIYVTLYDKEIYKDNIYVDIDNKKNNIFDFIKKFIHGIIK